MAKLREWSLNAALISCAGLVLCFSDETAQGIDRGITLCLEKIVPSLFPMMLICILMVESGLASWVGRLLAPAARKLFGLPGEGASAVLLSMIGGYPAGARAVTELYSRGIVSKKQAGQMIMFCFCSGPAFLVGVVGGLIGSHAAGWLLMGVQLVTVTLIGMLVCRTGRKTEQTGRDAETQLPAAVSVSDCVVASVSKTASAMLQVCLYVILFSAVNEISGAVGLAGAAEGILTKLGLPEKVAQAVLPSLLEVTGGCVRSAGAGLPMIAFAVGFGGLSVHMQVLAIARRLGVRQGEFTILRLLQGAMSAALTALLMKLLPDGAVTASAQLARPSLSGSLQGAVVLVVMCAVCVLCLPGRLDGGKNGIYN